MACAIAWGKIGSVREPTSLRPWLIFVAVNEAKRILRDDAKSDRRADWQCGLVTLRGEVLGTDQALTAIDGRYLDGHDCLFPELAVAWREP